MQLHNVHNLILEQPEVKEAVKVVTDREEHMRGLPDQYKTEHAAWAQRVRAQHPSEAMPPEPPYDVPDNVRQSAQTRVRLAEKDLVDVVTPLHGDLMTLLKEREVELLDEVRELVERINGIGEEIGSLIASAQWVDKQSGEDFDSHVRHPLYNRPPEVLIELASHENGSFIGIDDPDVWNLSKVGRHMNVSVRRTF